jgi:hypothetical protein
MTMAETISKPRQPTPEQLDAMHALYRQGGQERHRAPHIVYDHDTCPHAGCLQRLQALDFRLEAYGPAVHDPLVRAWWSDAGFVGRCPQCGGWNHFTIRGKRAVTPEEAATLPQLPDDWAAVALIL